MAGGENSVEKKDYISLKLFGQSMFPTFKNGETVLVKRVSPDKIKPGDIVAFKQYSQYVCHRVLKKEERDVFLLRGDFNRNIEKINGNDILGKVYGVYKKGRLKNFSFRSNYMYCWFVRFIYVLKEVIKKSLESIYSFRFFRKAVRRLFPCNDLDFVFIKDTQNHESFNGFFSFCPFLKDGYSIAGGFLTESGKVPVGKLWLLEKEKGVYFIYGPYVKLLYRGRNIGTMMVKKVLELMVSKENQGVIYALVPERDKTLGDFYRKLSFPMIEEENTRVKNFMLFKKILKTV